MTLFELLKNILLLIILIYFAPMVFEKITTQYASLLEPRTQIGIIHLKDNISTSYGHITELHSFFKNPAIKGIIIKMNYQQGPAGTCQTIFHEIRQLKKEYPKPIIALIENYCLAGGYLIASSSDYIIAPEAALIGNIGANFMNTEEEYKNNILLHNESYEKTSSTTLYNDIYQQLVKQIASARKLPLSTVSTWAEGKVFSGHQALALNLINEIGSMCTAIKYMKAKALIEGEIEWVEQK